MQEWLTLLQCPKLGVATLHKLFQKLPSLLSLFELSNTQLIELGLSSAQIDYLTSSHDYSNVISYLNRNHIQLISIEDGNYPQALLNTARPPIVLFSQGNISLLNRPQIAFVGSRTPTAYGCEVTKYLAAEISRHGLVVNSGLALGVDAMAHQATLDNKGYTVAVMGSGHANIYPKRHEQLAKRIVDNDGLLVSEFMPFETPQSFHFPRRNRIIAGLSLGTLVVEAALKSGSLITAKYALEANRDVFAVPGNIFSDVSVGCHNLIQKGAKLVQTPADILTEYEHVIGKSMADVYQGESFVEIEKNNLADTTLLANVDHETTSVDVISQRSNLPVEQVLIELLNLEILGHINAVPGGYIKVHTNINNK
ncbi:DNA-processing protein DprA [Psychrosphaera haliotis]|uniref:DNA-protecting protein DprA n=1 Tax=Psychrosphaera haliotis TaxID=555083 RepID=A0A6N8FEH5_9GAMM|nr:DNA-processing protein DprA [Psychrosphaera haliotis]MUH73567.1 DNA-protecting protein DprA [Psychrosphaera haliotis]